MTSERMTGKVSEQEYMRVLNEARALEAERDLAQGAEDAALYKIGELERQVEAARTALAHAQCSWAVWHQDCPIPKALAALAPQTGESPEDTLRLDLDAIIHHALKATEHVRAMEISGENVTGDVFNMPLRDGMISRIDRARMSAEQVRAMLAPQTGEVGSQCDTAYYGALRTR